VRAPPQGLREPVRAVLVEVEPRGLLARVALRSGVRVVPAHAHDAPALGAAELHLDAAVALAQDAGGRLPLTRRGSHHQFSLKGLRSRSKVQAERSWCTRWCTASAIPAGRMKKSSGRSAYARRVHGTSITASITT